MLRINVFLASAGRKRPDQVQALKAFYRALRDAGERPSLIAEDAYRPCDVAVVFGCPKDGKRAARARSMLYHAHAGAFVVLETPFLGRAPYIDETGLRAFVRRLLGKRNVVYRFGHFRIGVNGAFHNDADFCNAGSPPDRWRRLRREFGLDLRPYRATGSHVLIVGQVPRDTSLQGCDIVGWMNETIRRARRYTDRPIVVRPHPSTPRDGLRRIGQAIDDGGRVRIDLPPKGTIAEALENAWVTVTFSSSAAVDSLLAGVPAIAMSRASMAWPVTDHDIARIDSPTLHPREQWLYDLCYAQWSIDEIASGTVWSRLKPMALACLEQRASGAA